MLRDGYFIKEEPIKIGAHYVPDFFKRQVTPEERFMQDVILAEKLQQKSPVSRFLGRLLAF